MVKNKKDWTYILVLSITILVISITTFYIVYAKKFIKIPECIILKKLGVYCPGCGSTRAVYSLYAGKIFQSIYYNPFILYIAIVDFWYLITEGIAKLLKKENKFFIKDIRLYLYLALIVLALNWVIKLLMLARGINI